MTQAAKAQEPSMEEILASIRRIIADDDAEACRARPEAKAPEPPPVAKAPPPLRRRPSPLPRRRCRDQAGRYRRDAGGPRRGAGAGAEPRAAPEPEPADVLELTEAMQAPAPAFRKIDGTQDVVFDEGPSLPPPPRAAEPPRPAPAPPPPMADHLALRPRRRSIPRSMRSPIRCWCRTPRRWKIS